MKVYAPNEKYTGVSASVPFAGGVGETNNPRLIKWFQAHGYRVEKEAEETESPLPNEAAGNIEENAEKVSKGKRG